MLIIPEHPEYTTHSEHNICFYCAAEVQVPTPTEPVYIAVISAKSNVIVAGGTEDKCVISTLDKYTRAQLSLRWADRTRSLRP